MAKLTKKKLAKQGKEIITAAKKIRKKKPRTTWQSAMKQAGAEYRRKNNKCKKSVTKPRKKAKKK